MASLATILLIIIAFPPTRTSNMNQEACGLEQFFEKREYSWRSLGSTFECISRCSANFGIDYASRQPKLVERVFSPNRPFIDCLKEKRSVVSYCKTKISGITFKQEGDFPLYYFPYLVKARRFQAEKYCLKHGLRFGINETMLETILLDIDEVKIWAPQVQIRPNGSTPRVQCVTFKMNGKTLERRNESCGNENNFICTLPEICHSNRCSSQCQNKNCGNQQVTDCDVNCTKIDCSEETGDRFGIGPSDGEIVEMCGYEYLFTKTARYTQRGSQMFCCTKIMDVVDITTESELACFLNETIKRNLSSNSYWTNARLSTCPNKYAWCSSNPELANEQVLQAKKSSPFVALKPITGPNSIVWEFEDGSAIKRTICKREASSNCKKSNCFQVGCKSEISKNTASKGSLLYRLGCIEIQGCNKSFLVCLGSGNRFSYFQCAKWSCGDFYNFKLISFETKEKLDCVLGTFKSYKMNNTRFYLSATSFGCPSAPRWCNYVDNPPLNYTYLTWAKGEPSTDPNKECFYADYNATKNDFTFGKSNCRAEINFVAETIS
ncbi:uncharacterized protein LOC135935959 [Cloeon dipterum]|uniref:uncharacterized protein LOC135935959 n=1 Tax=Cloeon dipterum TaxID=197152 RepID=UPI00321FF485